MVFEVLLAAAAAAVVVVIDAVVVGACPKRSFAGNLLDSGFLASSRVLDFNTVALVLAFSMFRDASFAAAMPASLSAVEDLPKLKMDWKGMAGVMSIYGRSREGRRLEDDTREG